MNSTLPVSSPPSCRDTEATYICLCHSNQYTSSHISEDHFYYTPFKAIYKAFKASCWLNTDMEQKEYKVDTEALFEALMKGSFSSNDIAPVERQLKVMLKKRELYEKAQEMQREALDMTADVMVEEKEEGFDEFMGEIEQIGNDEFSLLETPWYKLAEDSRFTEGKSICFIVGEPGAGKSFFMTQLFGHFSITGVKAIQWQAENNKQFHARRSIAQYIGDSRLCDYEHLRRNVEEAKTIYANNRAMIDEVLSSIYNHDNLSKQALIKWCLAKAKEGYRVIGIDPLTYFSGGDKAHQDDQEIMTALNEIIKEYTVTFIIVTHPRNSGGSEISLDNIAGSRNLSRFCQNALWISRKDDPEINRVVYTLKTRNGRREHGGKSNMHFSSETVRFEEM